MYFPDLTGGDALDVAPYAFLAERAVGVFGGVSKPYKLMPFGAIAVTKHYQSIRPGAIHVTIADGFLEIGPVDVTKPHIFAVCTYSSVYRRLGERVL